MNRILLFILLLACAQSSIHSQAILDQYVKEAIEQNLSVDAKQAIERKQQYALQHAGKLAGPEVNFLTTYTAAYKGRNIELPLGDLLNPVYSALNDITGTQNFPPVANQEFNFLPNNFYDARFRITQPILQPEIKYNKLIKEEEVTMAGLQTDETIRDLTQQVKTAYIQWMRAGEAISIMDQGLTLLNENKRITESLIKNGQAIPSALMRIQSDIEHLSALREKSVSNRINAAANFNFLLNRPAGTEILADTFEGVPAIPEQYDLSHREELQQIQTGKKIQELALQLEEKQHAPTLGVQLDLGSQAFAADWGGYALGGLQLEIPIWDNKKSQLKQKEWKAQLDATQANYEWTKNAFAMQIEGEIENLRSDIALYNSFTNLLASNQRFYDETVRRYKEGLSNYIELLDARTEVTSTQLEQNLAKYQSWLRHVNIERMAAITSIN
ncbi:MAG: TolC family protein [Saprospiraceae bacterium]|nr:TolC family protein [Candidatus Opimibacter iunctus]